jgi:membrane protein
MFLRHPKGVTLSSTRRAVERAYQDALKNQTFQAAAALSYYSILCLFPALIFLSAVMAYIPLPNLFADVLGAMGRVLPPDSVAVVSSVLLHVLGTNFRTWLSLGMVGTLWVISSAFEEMIEALDAAYDVADHRSFWKARLLALGMAGITGFLMVCAIAVIIVAPRTGEWVAGRMFLPGLFISIWPLVHGIIAISFSIFAVQMIYFLGPNVKQRFRATLPGAVIAVSGCMGLSYLLGIYFRDFQNYDRIYGTLGGLMALMTWLYWASFILLAGGELNAELAKERNLPREEKPVRRRRIGRVA